MTSRNRTRLPKLAAVTCSALLLASACGSDDPDDAGESTASTASTEPATSTTSTADDSGASTDTTAVDTSETEAEESDTTVATSDEAVAADGTAGCEAIAALFVTGESANPDLADPEVAASCDGDMLVVTSNGIPDFTYIETSPGDPRAQDYTFTIPASPTIADTPTDVPYIGSAAVTLGGVPIFGPTEGTGGDVDSLPGIISVCGSHNGPTGFHAHKILASSETDCFFTPEEVAEGPQLLGYAFDGFPIYTGIDQYTSSWELTDETLFATDTWAAHTYVEGSGDLDQCNGLTDEDGNYAYYTTATFPYVLGCFTGTVEITDAGGGGGGGGGAAADGEERPERPERDEGEAGADEDRPERPEPADDAEGEQP